ncbi:hypothetical protein KAB08_03899 (plasmid) [Acinetobacter baumannii]|nr:hypothetical protein KAB08_03899 [Acinetobacter baumannii]
MSNVDPQLEHVDPAHPAAPDAYMRVLNCKSNYVNIFVIRQKSFIPNLFISY